MLQRSVEEVICTVRNALAGAESVVVLTGAGISAESGVPTYRGQGGLWRRYRATDLATPEAFAADPKLVWEFYNWRREILEPLRPNAAHLALAQLESRLPHFVLVTQNIDGLHQMAGSKEVLELHGNIWWVRCTGCGRLSEDRRVPLPPLPTCETCGALLRPHVVWFGENLDGQILHRVTDEVSRCGVMLVIGTSGTVQPAASLGMHAGKQGALVVEINLESTPYSGIYAESIAGKAGEIVPRLL